MLARVREKFELPVLTDVHTEEQTANAAEVVDILQIPAFLCRQTDLIEAAVNTGKIVNIKKGQFLSPGENRARGGQGPQRWRQKAFAHRTRHDVRLQQSRRRHALHPIMKQTGCPVIFDATHSVQLPGGGGDKSSGQREFAPVLGACARSRRAPNGLFIETHPNPDKALSDGPNMIALADMPAVLKSLLKVFAAVQ